MVSIRAMSAVVLPVVLGMLVGAGAGEEDRELSLEAASLDPVCILDELACSIVDLLVTRDVASGQGYGEWLFRER